MKQADLIVGQDYILDDYRHSHKPARYEGRHDGRLQLADGSTYIDGAGYLKFSIEQEDGERRVILVSTGASVIESMKAKQLRDEAQAGQEAKRLEAASIVEAYLKRLGFEVKSGRYTSVEKEPQAIAFRWPAEDPDEIQLEGVSFRKLKLLIERAKASLVTPR